MTSVEQSVDVAVPVRTAYNQWTQFEEFPRFMQGVERIEQRTPTRTHWVTRIAGVQREFDAEISEQVPDERIAWHALSGPTQSGVVTFHRLDDTHTRVMLQMAVEPEGVAEQAADKLGLIRSRINGDLKNFKGFVESRGRETGGWRGHVDTPGTAAHGTTASTPGAAPAAGVPEGPGSTPDVPGTGMPGTVMPGAGAAGPGPIGPGVPGVGGPGGVRGTAPVDRADPLSPYTDDYEPYREEGLDEEL